MAASGLEPPARSYGAYLCESHTYRTRHRLRCQHDFENCGLRESSSKLSYQARPLPLS
jgi:hypothetical protein